MIVVDTSALIAILKGEPSSEACINALAGADVFISAGTMAEALRRDAAQSCRRNDIAVRVNLAAKSSQCPPPQQGGSQKLTRAGEKGAIQPRSISAIASRTILRRAILAHCFSLARTFHVPTFLSMLPKA